MSPQTVSRARLHAVEISGDAPVVEGPLSGYHHDTYVFPLPGLEGEPGRRWKCREPRSSLVWFDRRCFVSEEQLLRALAGRLQRIPEVLDVGGIGLQAFIEGETLQALHPTGRPVPSVFENQLLAVFGQLAAISPQSITVGRRCDERDRPKDGDTDGFLERLIDFVECQVYQNNLDAFEGLFRELGIDGFAFSRVRKMVSGLSSRPFSLLHGDLHRKNLIVDPQQRLWVIDWELAMLGDPLYDLATHLYLMRYPRHQQERVVHRWVRTVEAVRPGSSTGWQQDLPRILAFKRGQSVFTDIIRVSLSLSGGGSFSWRALRQAVVELQKVLGAAVEPLALERVPSRSHIAAALLRWHRTRVGDASGPA
ncbi:aminoglycoside phosphotransferase family protein [Streptomyces longisporus]|uniref:aminoglycoside phosphotransferase family protein n=1 Tax=Streptomyces longisporus TaxID=1948 RepID=UPI0031DE83D7